MKTTSIITKTALCAICVFSTVPAFCVSGDGKIVKTAAKATFSAPRVARGRIQRFSFPPATTARIRTAIEAGKLERTVNEAALQHSPVPAPIVLGNTPKEITYSLHQLVSANPLEKEILQIIQQEEQFYASEITAAKELHNYLLSLHSLDEEEEVTIASSILGGIKNHSLQTYLLKSLENRDVYMLDLDLREYFNLDEPVEIAAFNYTLRHPHQQILMTRRLLNNPLVDEEVKQPFRNFLSKPKIKPEEFPAFQTAIANVYNQYKQRIAAAKESDIIQAQAKYYEKLTDRLDHFIVTYGRLPKWNTTNPQEAQLSDEIEWVQHHRQDNQFEPLVSYQKTLDLTLEKAKPVYLTRQETLELFEDFVKTTNRLYPRSLRDKPKAGDIPFQREEELWDNLSYWRVEDSSLFQDITKIYEKHLH